MENSSVDSKRDHSWQQEQKTYYLSTTNVLQSYPAKNWTLQTKSGKALRIVLKRKSG